MVAFVCIPNSVQRTIIQPRCAIVPHPRLAETDRSQTVPKQPTQLSARALFSIRHSFVARLIVLYPACIHGPSSNSSSFVFLSRRLVVIGNFIVASWSPLVSNPAITSVQPALRIDDLDIVLTLTVTFYLVFLSSLLHDPRTTGRSLTPTFALEFSNFLSLSHDFIISHTFAHKLSGSSTAHAPSQILAEARSNVGCDAHRSPGQHRRCQQSIGPPSSHNPPNKGSAEASSGLPACCFTKQLGYR